jgi:hypothetical protein
MSQSNFRVRKGLTVEGDSQTTGSATVNGSVILTGTTSGQINLTAPAVAGSQPYTLPTGLPASNGYVLASQTDGTMSWVDNSATGTTYTIDATTVTGGADFNLTGSDLSVDTIKFAESGATTVTRTDANTITISSTDTNTTYTQDASSTTGGANLNLQGSDLTTDTIKFANGTNVTVTATDANTITIAATDTNTTYTQDASSTTGGANLNLQGSDSTTDTVKFAGGTNVTVTATDANTITIDGTDTNTTYTIDATSTTGGANFNLTGSDLTTDTIKFAGTGATSVTRTDANTITIDSVDTDTTYTIEAGSITGGAKLNLLGSDLSVDTVNFADGTGVTITSPNANDIKIAIGQDVATSANPQFAGATLGNITVGVATDNTITTTTGDLVLDSTSGTISTVDRLSVGADANFTDWPNAQFVASQANGGDNHPYNMGVVGEGVATSADANRWGVGVYGNGFTNGSTRAAGVLGDGSVSAAGDTGTAYGVRGYATDTHTGGTNIGLYADAANSSIGNYALVMAAGNILSVPAQTWTLADNNASALSFDASGAAGILKVVTTNSAEGVAMSGTLDVTGNISYANRILGSGSQTIRTGPNRVTGFAAISGATSEDIITVGIGASGVPLSGLLVTNSGLPTGSTSGRRQGILIRDFGGQEYNGTGTTTPQGVFMGESSRGTLSEPRGLGAGGPLAAFQGFSNAGSDLTSGNTPYWTAEKYPTAPAFGILANQTHKGPWGTAAAAAQFTADISGTTLNVTAVSSGTLALGHEIKLSTGANFPTTTNAFQIIAQTSGTTGSTGTYTLNASPGTVASTSMFSTVTTLGSQFFVNVQPQNTPITSTSRAQSSMSGESIIFRAQSANTASNIFSVQSLPTTAYIGVAGVGNGFAQGTNKTYFSISDTQTLVTNQLQIAGTLKSQGLGFTLIDNTNVQVIGSGVNYNRVYGQWQNLNTITPAASNTAYAFALPTVDFTNIASVGSTSRIIPGAAGMYKLQFSAQVQNDDTANEHIAYFWWRKNGTDVPGSMGRVGIFKAQGGNNGLTIAGWDNMIQSANATDYWELMYAVDDATHVDFPAFASTAFGPQTSSLFVTLVPIGM